MNAACVAVALRLTGWIARYELAAVNCGHYLLPHAAAISPHIHIYIYTHTIKAQCMLYCSYINRNYFGPAAASIGRLAD